MFGMFLRSILGIIQLSTLTTILSVSIVENPICSHIVSKLAIKQRLHVTGKRIWINALMVPVTMAARSSPKATVEAKAAVEEETPIGPRLLGCCWWETRGCAFATKNTADGIQPILLGFIIHRCRTGLILLSLRLTSFVSRLALRIKPLKRVSLPLMLRLMAPCWLHLSDRQGIYQELSLPTKIAPKLFWSIIRAMQQTVICPHWWLIFRLHGG